MPFKSEKQRRYLFANEPEIAKDWTETYGSKIKKAYGGRIGYYSGGQSIPSEYTVEDARKTAMQDRLGGITEVMKQADLYRQGDVGQMYMADGGIMRVPLAYGMSPGEAQARGLGAESHGREFGGKDETAALNIHAGMKSPNLSGMTSVVTPRGDRSSGVLQNIDKGMSAINLLNFVKNPTVFGALKTMTGPFGLILGASPMMENIYDDDDDEEQTLYNMGGLASLWQK
jgi:hypothetical protein